MELIIKRSKTEQKLGVHFLFCAVLIFALLVFMRDVVGLGISRFVFIGLATIALLLFDKSEIYCFIAFLTPLATGISLTYIAAIALVIRFIKFPRIHIRLENLLPIIAILILELLSSFRGGFSYIEFLRFVGIFILANCYIFDSDDNYDHERFIKYYLLGFCVAMSDIFGQMLKEYSLIEIFSLNIRFGNIRQDLVVNTEGMLVSYNSNGLGYLCLLAALFSLLISKKQGKKKYLILFFAATLIGVMTQSRAFILMFAVSIILYIILSCRTFVSGVRTISLFAVSGILLYFATMKFIPGYIESLLTRFQADDITGGRSDIFSYYFEHFFDSFDRVLLGVGLQNYQGKYGYNDSAHMALQEVLITWGVIGLFFVILLLVGILVKAHRKNSKAKMVQYLPFIMHLLIVQSGQGFSDRMIIFRVMLTYAAIRLTLNSSVNKGEKNNV